MKYSIFFQSGKFGTPFRLLIFFALSSFLLLSCKKESKFYKQLEGRWEGTVENTSGYKQNVYFEFDDEGYYTMGLLSGTGTVFTNSSDNTVLKDQQLRMINYNTNGTYSGEFKYSIGSSQPEPRVIYFIELEISKSSLYIPLKYDTIELSR